MNTLSTSSWLRSGSSILFNAEKIQELLKANAMVSLREFLAWRDEVPDNPPVSGQTILICGLETIVDTLSEDEAETFLEERIRPVIRKIQNRWTETGLVFGFSTDGKAFVETQGIKEEVLFKRGDGQTIHISNGLWEGISATSLLRLELVGANGRQLIGYHVTRLS